MSESQGWLSRDRLLPLASDAIRYGLNLFWLFADQGVFASTNFLLNVLFARWLSQSDYGIFALTFSGYLILTLIHYGMILEPLLVQSGKIEPRCHRSYVVTVIKAHLLVNCAVIGLSLIAMAILLALGLPTAGYGAIGAGAGGIMLLTLLTARRLCLKFLNTRISAFIGLIYLFGVIASAYILYVHQLVTWSAIWIILGTWALICSSVLFIWLCLATTGDHPYSLRTLYHFQMRYAYFSTAAASAQWLRFDGVMVALASLVGVETVAEVRAMFSLVNPMTQVNLALQTSWLLQSSEADLRNERVPVARIALAYATILSMLIVLAWWFQHDLVQLVYGGRYLSAAWQLPCLMAMVGCMGIESVLTCNLKGRGRVWRGYAPPIVGAIVATLLSWMLIPQMGVLGAIDAAIGSAASGMLIGMLVFR